MDTKPNPPSPGRTSNYNARLAMILNIVQIICGGIVILFSLVTLGNIHYDNQPLSGTRFGAMYLIAGILGLLAAKYRTYGFIIPNMVMSIFACISAILLFVAGAIALAQAINYLVSEGKSLPIAMIVGSVIMFIITLAEIVCSIWVSVMSGRIVCPCTGTDRGGEGKLFTDYRSTPARILGIIKIVLCILMIIFGIVRCVLAVASAGPSKRRQFLNLAAPLTLSGVAVGLLLFALPAGILGILSAARRTLPLIISHMVMCILTAVTCGSALLAAFVSLPAGVAIMNESNESKGVAVAGLVFDVLLLLISLTLFIAAIWGSCVSCCATCCGAVDSVPPRPYKTFNQLFGKIIGSVQIIIGILSILFNIGLLKDIANSGGYGFVCGIMYIIAGSFGIKAAQTKIRSKILAFWILSLITILCAITQLGMSIKVVLAAHTAGNKFVGSMQLIFSLIVIVAAIVATVFSVMAARDDAILTRSAHRTATSPPPQAAAPPQEAPPSYDEKPMQV